MHLRDNFAHRLLRFLQIHCHVNDNVAHFWSHDIARQTCAAYLCLIRLKHAEEQPSFDSAISFNPLSQQPSHYNPMCILLIGAGQSTPG